MLNIYMRQTSPSRCMIAAPCGGGWVSDSGMAWCAPQGQNLVRGVSMLNAIRHVSTEIDLDVECAPSAGQADH
jgi:hypothetical protein